MVAVLHVVQPTTGGAAAYVAAAAAEQRARSWRVAVAAPGTGWLAETLARHGVPLLPWAVTRDLGAATVREALQLARLVRAFRPDVVHLHCAKAGLTGRIALRGALPTLFQPHGWSWLAATGAQSHLALGWERFATRWTGTVVCVSDGEARLGRRSGIGGRFAVVRNGVDLTRFRLDGMSKEHARAMVGVAPEVPLVVCVGRICRQKGQDLLLAEWRRVLALRPDAWLVLAGPLDGTRPPGARGVHLVGEVSDVRPWLYAADVVVQPSRWEGLPFSALEALACGRPVVASDVDGLAEVVRPGTGAAVATAAIGHEILRLLADPARAEAEGRAGARLVRREFDVRETFARLAEVTENAARSANPCVGHREPHPLERGPRPTAV
ncbi:glycosyltransferase [Lentzea flava]|uniref:Glycosyl transferase family 1 n=1 Tax=Lentzea flava TaxID=103732 RepID=A0ABQ2UCT2_9PSEU|nr:glycosyltransferase [Lentzea flava]MCP2196760.1 Glycosyltransferase involved in cell wall bisynthesis [Lentzea flava]GGU15714.1 glycosyl transferase family 1 [Lentzea flava]